MAVLCVRRRRLWCMCVPFHFRRRHVHCFTHLCVAQRTSAAHKTPNEAMRGDNQINRCVYVNPGIWIMTSLLMIYRQSMTSAFCYYRAFVVKHRLWVCVRRIRFESVRKVIHKFRTNRMAHEFYELEEQIDAIWYQLNILRTQSPNWGHRPKSDVSPDCQTRESHSKRCHHTSKSIARFRATDTPNWTHRQRKSQSQQISLVICLLAIEQ